MLSTNTSNFNALKGNVSQGFASNARGPYAAQQSVAASSMSAPVIRQNITPLGQNVMPVFGAQLCVDGHMRMLQQTVARLQQDNQALRNENYSLRGTQDHSAEMIDGLINEKLRLQGQVAELTSKNIEQTRDGKKLGELSKKLIHSHKGLKQQLARASQTNAKLKRQCRELKNANATLLQTSKKLRLDNSRLRGDDADRSLAPDQELIDSDVATLSLDIQFAMPFHEVDRAVNHDVTQTDASRQSDEGSTGDLTNVPDCQSLAFSQSSV